MVFQKVYRVRLVVPLIFSAFPDCSLTISGIQDNSVALGAHFFRIYAYEQSTERNVYRLCLYKFRNRLGCSVHWSLQTMRLHLLVFSHSNGTSWKVLPLIPFEISESAQFSTLFDTATTFNNFYTNENDFVVDTQYYWRVLAENHCDATYCPTKTFRTSSLFRERTTQ